MFKISNVSPQLSQGFLDLLFLEFHVLACQGRFSHRVLLPLLHFSQLLLFPV